MKITEKLLKWYGHVIYTIICLKSACLSAFAILARASREMSLTVRIVSQYIPSRVHVSVRPSIFYTRKTLINYHESRPSRIWLLNVPAARPVTMHSATVTVEWPATRRCVDTTAVILIRTDWPKTAKINQSKLRQLEFIHSRLEQCGLGIITWPMRM